MAGQGFSMAQQQRQIMAMAPQLRQSLEILQMPVMELREVIQKEMVSNPTIEMSDPTEISANVLEQPHPEAPAAQQEMDFNPDVDALLRQEDDWRDYFMQGMENAPSTEDAEEKRRYLFDSIRQEVTLQDHLLEQLGLTNLRGKDVEIAQTLIGNINDAGYFTGSLPDIIMISGMSETRILEILSTIQTFDPPGVGSRTLRECLLRQLDQVEDSPWEDEARLLIDRYLENLAAHDEKFLCKALNLNRDELQHVIALVKSLNPQPGLAFAQYRTEYVQPEVFVFREKGKFIAHVESSRLPQIHISNRYREMLEDQNVSKEAKSYIRERIRAGAFLINSIDQRQQTIQRIAQCIVDAQTDFLKHGVSALKPMTMVDVAKQVGVHETTVSRTVSNKYMRTPVGIFEMKYFFTPGLKNKSGATISNKTIQDLIKRLVDSEDPRNPLSDQAIEEKLAEQGYTVARRTINKYRGILKIPPASKRRYT